MHMVYRVMGMAIPKNIREKLAKGGADFADYFPQRANNNPCHNVYKGTLGLIEIKPAAEDHELVHPDKKNKVDVTPFTLELEAALQQHKMEYEVLQKVNANLVNENRELKEHAVENKKKVKDMKLMI